MSRRTFIDDLARLELAAGLTPDDTVEILARVTEPGSRECRECGCTDEHPCRGGCHWVAADLCSRCVL